MKTNSIFSVLLFIIPLLFFSSCKKEDVITGVKIDEKTLALGLSETKLLKACTYPASNDCGMITWSTSDAAVATVDATGLVTGVAKGEAIVYASIGSFTDKCSVTVFELHTLPVSLTGTDYYLISLDNFSAAAISEKIIADYRVNETTNAMYIWKDSIKNVDTYSLGTCVGTNFYDEDKKWISLIVGNAGWSGARFYSSDTTSLKKLSVILNNPSDYHLHIAMKDTAKTVFMFGLFDNNNYRFAVGDNSFNDVGTLIPALSNFTRDGQWHEFDIPMSHFANGGFVYNPKKGGINIFWVLSGGISGTKVQFDAVFIYKKPKN